MLFNSVQFAVFLVFVVSVYMVLPRSGRNAWLLTASLVFYTVWIPVYVVLLLIDVAVNYALVRMMLRSQVPRRYLVASVVFTLGLLAYFKYAAFLLDGAGTLVGWVWEVPESVEILLPLGISFYSFQIIALSVDVYRKDVRMPDSFSRYLLFISFFPQLIAGPILRGREFLPQLEAGGQVTLDRTRRGLWLIASGLFKKIVLGDFLLAPFVNEVYSFPGSASAPVQLIAAYSFAFQIYFDFAGYTDMARGMACLFGFDMPSNFQEPYLSRNPAEFWRRWHMTLSRWLRDYVYIPLGGNRKGPSLTYLNLLLTMLLGGLWHGAGWTFVAWGALHGILLALHRFFGRSGHDASAPLTWRDAPKIILLFNGVCLFWIFFRSETIVDAWAIIERLATGSYRDQWPVLQTAIVAGCFMLHGVERFARLHAKQIRAALGMGFGGALVEGIGFGIVLGLAIAASGTGAAFIYFQF